MWFGTLTSAAGLSVNTINPFLIEAGVGLTAAGKEAPSPATIKLSVSADGEAVAVDPVALQKDKFSRVTPDELRRLCVAFQHRAKAIQESLDAANAA